MKICDTYAEPFIRNGKTFDSGWKKEYTPELVEKAEKWIDKHLADTEHEISNKKMIYKVLFTVCNLKLFHSLDEIECRISCCCSIV